MGDNNNPYENNNEANNEPKNEPDNQQSNEPNNQDANQNQYDQTGQQSGNQQPYGSYQEPQYQSPDWMNQQQNQQYNQNPYNQNPYNQNQNNQNQYNQGQYNQYQQPYSQYNQYQQPDQPQSNGMAIGALVCGILGFLLSCCWFISLPLSIISIILGSIVVKKNKPGRTMAIVGIILGAVTVVISVAILLIGIFSFSSGEFGSWYQQYYDEFSKDFDPSVY